MQPLKMVIAGQYWDSLIYSGRLYLFRVTGEIVTIDWDRFVEAWQIDESLRIAFDCAFARSDYLYGQDIARILYDVEIRRLVQSKFWRLGELAFEARLSDIAQSTIRIQDNPLPFPHADCEIYDRHIYSVGPAGVYGANCNKRTVYPVSTRVAKYWDAPVSAVAPGYGCLALAAGQDGLFEMTIGASSYGDSSDRADPPNLSRKHCTDCSRVFQSVYGSSHVGRGVLAAFARVADFAPPRSSADFDLLRSFTFDPRTVDRSQLFDRAIPDAEIFGGEGYSWGVQDKLYQAQPGRIEAVRYVPWEREPAARFQHLGQEDIGQAFGEIVSASTAVFGVVLELSDAIVVLPSQGEPVALPGEPVNWRVFPRSRRYENQLHVLYDDRLEIYSFNHDYFVDQEGKTLGIRFFPRR